MFRNNLRIAIRTFLKQKGYSLINIAGLAIGLAACLFILLWVIDELSYDRFHSKIDRIYLVGLDAKLGTQEFTGAASPPTMAEALMGEVTGVEKASRFRGSSRTVKYGEHVFTEDHFCYVDSVFFDIFDFEFLQGNPETALDQPNSVVLTEEMKKKYFGDGPALGEVLRIDGRTDYKVTGVIRDVPSQSSIEFDFLASINSLPRAQPYEWGSNNLQTIALLKEGVSREDVEAQFGGLLEKYFGPIIQQIMNISLQEFYDRGSRYYYFLEPFKDLHLRASFTEGYEGASDMIYVYLLSLIALFILVIACINFVNLTTARSTMRAREVGIKKVVGSGRRSLIWQFLLESVLLSLAAMFLAMVIVQLLLPAFNHLSEKELSLNYLHRPLIGLSLLGLTLLAGVVAGSYSAFAQSNFKIIPVLSGEYTRGRKSSWVRNALVVFQFSISIFLIICTVVVFRQIRYMQNMDLGFNKEHLLAIENFDELEAQQKAYKERALDYPGIVKASVTQEVPGRDFPGNGILKEGTTETEVHILSRFVGDKDLLETLGARMAEGRYFSDEFRTDTNALVLNQIAVKSLALEDPLNQQLLEPSRENIPRSIIGIVQDFHYQSAHNIVRPMAMEWMRDRDLGRYLLVRVRGDEVPATLKYLEDTWKEMTVDEPFHSFFIDQDFDRAYRQEERLRTIYGLFALLAVFIACLGLLGLASYTAERKTKSIGIRKAMGSSVGGIVLLLTREFVQWVLLANLFAWPAAWYLMKDWLNNFAFRQEMTVWIFLGAGLVSLVVATLTVIYKSYRAATTNPAHSLRYE